jgi:hypothetical protein
VRDDEFAAKNQQLPLLDRGLNLGVRATVCSTTQDKVQDVFLFTPLSCHVRHLSRRLAASDED